MIRDKDAQMEKSYLSHNLIDGSGYYTYDQKRQRQVLVELRSCQVGHEMAITTIRRKTSDY